MNRPTLASFVAAGLLLVPSFASGQQNAGPRPPRTFPEFAGTWVPDSLHRNVTDSPQQPMPRPGSPVGGFDPNAPQVVVPPEPKLVITTTPTRITLTTTPPAPHGPDVYRFDGVPTNVGDGQGTLTLVAGSLLLTVKSTRMLPGNFESTLTTTDLLSVSGDVLTIERQYSRAIRPMGGDKVGYIQSVDEGKPSDTRVKMVYRRQAATGQ